MKKTTALTGLVAGGLGAVLLMTPLTAGAVTTTAEPTRVPAVIDRSLDHAVVQGVVTDQMGAPVDDVLVEAVRTPSADAEVVASTLSHASSEDEVEHGFYRLYFRDSAESDVLPGEYWIRYSSLGSAADPFRTTYYPAPVTLADPDVAGEWSDVWLDDVTMMLARQVATTTTAEIRPTLVKKNGKRHPVGRVDVAVDAAELPQVDGVVRMVLTDPGSTRAIKTTAATLVDGRATLNLPPSLAGPAKVKPVCQKVQHQVRVKGRVKVRTRSACTTPTQPTVRSYTVSVSFDGTTFALPSSAAQLTYAVPFKK